MTAWAGPGDGTDAEIPLCRIEYLGGDDWAFALYDPAAGGYRDTALDNGQYTGPPPTPTTPPPSPASPTTRSNSRARGIPSGMSERLP